MTQSALYNGIGLIGDVMIIGAYLLLQLGKLRAKGAAFLLLNVVGSVAILLSLRGAWSLTLCVIQTCWLLISLFGVYRHANKWVG